MARVFLILLAVISSGLADPVASIPEIEGPRAAFQQALAKIRADRTEKTAAARRDYAARLDALRKQLLDQGDDEAANAVSAEMDRMVRGVEPTQEERRRMTGLLLATRVLYEKACGPANMEAMKRESQAQEAWKAGLAQLEAHLTSLRQFNKVAAVKAERALLEKPQVEAKTAANVPAALDPATLNDDLIGVWDFRSGRWKGTREFKPDGTFTYGTGVGRWTATAGELKLEYRSKQWEKFALPPKDGQIFGVNDRAAKVTGKKR